MKEKKAWMSLLWVLSQLSVSVQKAKYWLVTQFIQLLFPGTSGITGGDGLWRWLWSILLQEEVPTLAGAALLSWPGSIRPKVTQSWLFLLLFFCVCVFFFFYRINEQYEKEIFSQNFFFCTACPRGLHLQTNFTTNLRHHNVFGHNVLGCSFTRYCCTYTPSEQIISETNQMMVIFKAVDKHSNSGQRRGFQLKYVAGKLHEIVYVYV